MIQEFKNLVHSLGIELSERQLEQFDIYFHELVEWNDKINLTAITDLEGVYMKHFYDSLTLVKAITIDKQKILDVGSGAGFPSIPLKIVYPEIEVTIIDSLNKRIKFLDNLCQKLEINAQLIHGRAEEMKEKNHYDIVTARAVANLRILGELCIPFVKKGGYFISPKGPKYKDELEECKNLFKSLNASLEDVVEYEVDGDFRAVLKIKKNKVSANKYPRRFSKIKSNPL